MKSKHSDKDQRYLLLFKIDANNLYDRVVTRREDYIDIFGSKRTKDHFDDVFFSRYKTATIDDLSHCPLEVIETLNHFHTLIDKLYWYLKHTEDMPNTIEDEVLRDLSKIEKAYEMLNLYIDAELTGVEHEASDN